MATNEMLVAAKRRLAEIDAEAVHLRALVAIYEGNAPTADSRTQARAGQQDDGPTRRSRRVPADWVPILLFVTQLRDEAFTLDEIQAFSDQSGLGHSRDRVRGQLHNWRARGWLDNPAHGQFRPTETGLEEASRYSNGADRKPAPLPAFESGSESEADDRDSDLLNPNTAHGGGG